MLAAADPTPAEGQGGKEPEPSKLFPDRVRFEKLGANGEAVYTLEAAPAKLAGTGKGLHWDVEHRELKTDGPFSSVRITDKYGKVYKSTKTKVVNNALRVYHDGPEPKAAP